MAASKYRKLSHVVFKCDYHIVWTPKYRYRVLFGEVKALVENDIEMLFKWKGVEVLEKNVQSDHIHLVCSPKGLFVPITFQSPISPKNILFLYPQTLAR